jgi:hypothetical protein
VVSDAKDVPMIMKPKHLLLVLTMVAIAAPTVLLAQQHALPGDMEAPLPTGPLSWCEAMKKASAQCEPIGRRTGPTWNPYDFASSLRGSGGGEALEKELCAGTWQTGSLTENCR